uniref:C2H2-type domain-containing protein n=1 Tax=Vespula pensylvanica TaxID=30213 RepID=A0A834KQJ4_VESPE|nr:hypothetical protein H0235_013362 [Vespula pensylvanica]
MKKEIKRGSRKEIIILVDPSESRNIEIHYDVQSKTLSYSVTFRRKKYSCPKCVKTFVQKCDLGRHLKYECGQAPRFQCPYCNLRSKQRENVYTHVRKIHRKREKRIKDQQASRKSFHVQTVQEQINHDQESSTHKTDGTNVRKKKIQCPKCSRSFFYEHRLSAHLHECGQTLKYQCPYCRYQHKLRADIYKHVQKKHKKKEVYAMEIDRNEVKPRAQELKKQSYHTKIGRRKFPCPKCSSTFVHKHDVKKHLTFICGQTPRFKCPYCTNCTKYPYNIYTHIRKKHKKNEVYTMDIVENVVYKP